MPKTINATGGSFEHYQGVRGINYVWYFVSSEAIVRTVTSQWKAGSYPSTSQDFVFSVMGEGAGDLIPMRMFSAKQDTWIPITNVFKMALQTDQVLPTNDSSLGK